jgi:hypothetical protein
MPKSSISAVKESPATTVIEKTVTTTVNPPSPSPSLGVPRSADWPIHDPDINVFFAQEEFRTAEQRAGNFYFYVKRWDPRVAGTTDTDSGVTLKSLSVEDLREFSDEPFMPALEKWILAKGYGGGRYRLLVPAKKSIRNGEVKNNSLFYNLHFQIAGEPVLQTTERWADPARAALDAAKVTTHDAGQKVLEALLDQVRANQISPQQAIEQAAAQLEKVNEKAAQLARESIGRAGDPLAMVKELLSFLKEQQMIVSPVASGPHEPPAAAPKSPVETWRELLELKRLMQDDRDRNDIPTAISQAVTEALKAAGGFSRRSSGGTSWLEAAGEIAKVLSPALAPIGVAVAEKIRSGAPLRGSVAQQIGPRATPQFSAIPQPGYAAPVQTGASAAPPAPGSRNGSQPAASAPPPPAQALTTETVNSVAWMLLTTQFVDWVRHDMPGAEAAATIQNMFPDAAVRLRMMGVAELQAMIAADNVLAALKDDPRLPVFLAAFLDYFREEEGEVDEAAPRSESIVQ